MEKYSWSKTEVKLFPVKTKMRINYKLVSLPLMNDNFWYDFMQRIAGMKQNNL